MKPGHPFTPQNLGLSRERPLESIAFFLLIVFIASAALPWGAVLPGGRLKIEAFAFAILFIILVSRTPLRPLRLAAIPLAALAALASLGATQLIPLDGPLLASVSPLSTSVYSETNRILAVFGRATVTPRISIAPFETKSATLLVLSYAALFSSSLVLLQSRRRRRTFAAILLGTAIAHAVWSTATFGPRETGRIAGPFVNPNHFGGYLAIALAIAFGVLWREILHNRERGRGAKDHAETIERRLAPVALCVLLWGVIAVGIGLTKSRAGIAAALVTTFILAVIGVLHQRLERRTRVAVGTGATLLAAIALAAFIARDEPMIRFLESDPREIGADTRVTLWRTSLDAWKLSPHSGSGLGTFREVFRHVQPRELEGLVEQAHSDPLQLLVTGGWIGLACGFVALASAVLILANLWRAQRHREEEAFALAGLGALLSLVLHGLVEFNFSIPAIPATLACVTGWAMAAGMYDQETESGRTE